MDFLTALRAYEVKCSQLFDIGLYAFNPIGNGLFTKCTIFLTKYIAWM